MINRVDGVAMDPDVIKQYFSVSRDILQATVEICFLDALRYRHVKYILTFSFIFFHIIYLLKHDLM